MKANILAVALIVLCSRASLGQQPAGGYIYAGPAYYIWIAPRYYVPTRSPASVARYQRRRELVRQRVGTKKATGDGSVGYEIIFKPIAP